MSNLQKTNRVLGRAGARQLSVEELRQVAGGFVVSKYVTGACVFDPIACRVISGNKQNRLTTKGHPFGSPFTSSGSLRAGCETQREFVSPESGEIAVIARDRKNKPLTTDEHG